MMTQTIRLKLRTEAEEERVVDIPIVSAIEAMQNATPAKEYTVDDVVFHGRDDGGIIVDDGRGGMNTATAAERAQQLTKLKWQLWRDWPNIEAIDETVTTYTFEWFDELVAEWKDKVPAEYHETAEIDFYWNDDDEAVAVTVHYRRQLTPEEQAEEQAEQEKRSAAQEVHDRKWLRTLLERYPDELNKE
jgi:hypothetical protein